ncbi:MAG TPA: hypothetical protein VGC16_06455, partial [Rhizomicrobium sp.]
MIARIGLILALLAAPAAAEPLLHPMFADHAVLQRGQPIRIYGQTHPGAQVSVTLAGAAATVRAGKDGSWNATLPAMAAGGPYTLDVSGDGAHQVVNDVLLGDVFLCTGQSNM